MVSSGNERWMSSKADILAKLHAPGTQDGSKDHASDEAAPTSASEKEEETESTPFPQRRSRDIRATDWKRRTGKRIYTASAMMSDFDTLVRLQPDILPNRKISSLSNTSNPRLSLKRRIRPTVKSCIYYGPIVIYSVPMSTFRTFGRDIERRFHWTCRRDFLAALLCPPPDFFGSRTKSHWAYNECYDAAVSM